jgi:uncharacterized damage-inducible protein DinB
MWRGGKHVTYYGGKEIAAGFRTVRGNTLAIAEEIPESQYGFRPSPDVRSVAQLLAHIAYIPMLQMEMHSQRVDDLANVNFGEYMARAAQLENTPRSKAELIALIKSEGDKFTTFVEGLSEATLAETVKMPPGASPAAKSRFEMLLSPKEHEMHHRGQLMLIQRLLGLTPHLTRQMQQRIAQRAAQAQQAAR